jgi:hypothetical protein
MTSAPRDKLLMKLKRISELAPEVRFGQLTANLANLAGGPWDETLWNVEDEHLLAAAEKLLTDLEARQASVA